MTECRECDVTHWFDNKNHQIHNEALNKLYTDNVDKPFIALAKQYPPFLQQDFILLNLEYPGASVYQDCDKHSKLVKIIEWIATRKYEVWLEYGLVSEAVKMLLRLSRANNITALIAVMEFYRITGSSLHGKSAPIDEICNITQLGWNVVYPMIKTGIFKRIFVDWDLLDYDGECIAISKQNMAIHQCTFNSGPREHPFLNEKPQSTYFEEKIEKTEEDTEELPIPDKKKKKWF